VKCHSSSCASLSKSMALLQTCQPPFNEVARRLVSHSPVFQGSVFSVSRRQNSSTIVMASAELHLLAPPYIPLFVFHKWGTIDEMSSLEAR
jgi:hypothetical protein